MYKVFCDGYTLHDPSLNDVHFQLISPVVTQEANKAGSFTFTIPAAHANANALKRLLSSVEVYDDSKLIFRGRILNDTRDWDDSRKVVCESDIAVLNDTTQRPYTFTGTVAEYISQLINTHNAMAPVEKQFTVGTVSVSGTVSVEQTGYSSTWHELEEKVLNQFSGYLFVTWTGSANRIDFLADSPYHCEQKISFGENLLDITRESKGENIITALIPLGAKVESTGEPLTIKSVNGGIDYITNASAVAAYGLIFGTETWDTVTNAAELLARGQARLAELSQGVTTITLTAADLHLLDNEISSFDFLSYVTVEDLAHGVNGTMLVTKKMTNLTDPAQGKLTIGRESSGISKYYAETSDQIQTIRQTYATQEQVDTVNTTLQSEIQTQADKIALVVSESAGSYVIKSAEIVAAINESGSTVQISADHIALTGALIVSMINGGSTTIDGSKITTGTLNASAIGAGKITVYDNNSAILFEADKDTNQVQIAGFTVEETSLDATYTGDTGSSPDSPIVPNTTYTRTVKIATDRIQMSYDYYRYSEDTNTPYSTSYRWWLYPHRLRFRGDFRNDPDDPRRSETTLDPWALRLYKYTSSDPETETNNTVISPVRMLNTNASNNTKGYHGSDHVNLVDAANDIQASLHPDALRMYNAADSTQATKYTRLNPDSLIFYENGSSVATITRDGPGTTYSSGTASSVANETWTTLTSLVIPRGTWLIVLHASFASNSTGTRRVLLSNSQNSGTAPSEIYIDYRNAMPAGVKTHCHVIAARKVSSDTTMYMNAYQGSGSSLSASWQYQLMRIL